MKPLRHSHRSQDLGGLLHDASRLRRNVFDTRFKRLNLTRAQWWVLWWLSKNAAGGINQTTLARELDVGKVTLGGIVSRLHRAQYIAKIEDEKDARSRRLFVTPKGSELLKRVEGMAAATTAQITKGIAPEDEEKVIEILARMKKNLIEMDGFEFDVALRLPQRPAYFARGASEQRQHGLGLPTVRN